MSLPNLDMDVMRTLLAAHQLGSLNRAAERVGRSQSAISQQIRKLEEQVGLPLFRRQGRGLVLTDAGDMILSYAKRILDLNDEAIRSVRGAVLEGSVRFGLPGDFAETWLPAVLGAFKKTHPAVRVEVAVEPNRLLLERLDKGELDLVLALDHQARPDAEHVARLPMTWIGPANVEIRPSAGGPLDLALYNPPCLFRRVGVQALDDANISWRLAYTTASLHSLWAGVAAGLGITLRTATGIPPALRRLGTRDGLPELPSIDLCLHGAHRKLSPALEQLKRVVLKSAVEHLAA
ncbi:LysR substrate-binding domain-containing protein [Burkholderia pseudomallei]|uniref:LysR substrate-binding domain-containing protein n=1 Tax=Burkholderia pseudomallei TaxID=28450 RepID=UPI00050DE3F8|nr:LysR substrate-binding domain-containing protein [Burkholderia pseudomallei]KGC37066.1 bacterial regulatory helix-turn-helix, lysR family protein [Burkholderia pseudomallei]KGC92607.1 bacterial regulatory helix-turn-helix, lysR family protein [Burkholderia pseudomallei]OMT50492.1 LysR family transcriptional regulator [Burkholderia pseudomallei]OMZ16979.1 LysR family transcriptional regulator [Burkholderia pseudomallei]OMZ31378.1 LysR family transcriptional regulator [Burkholderia pseudomall